LSSVPRFLAPGRPEPGEDRDRRGGDDREPGRAAARVIAARPATGSGAITGARERDRSAMNVLTSKTLRG
jgi:hypothetical protein